MTHHGFTYKEGLNIDHIPFNPINPIGKCMEGGLYFCEAADLYRYLEYGTLIADVEIPPDAQVYREEHKLKADRIILKNIVPLEKHVLWSDPDFCKTIVSRCGSIIIYVRDQNDEVCNIAIMQNGYAIFFVKDQSDEMCKTAVSQHGCALRYVKDQTEELCKIAVAQNGNAIQYVKHQNEELCKIAVSQDGHAIRFVKDQTDTICRIAIAQNKNAYVKMMIKSPTLDSSQTKITPI
jgi:hypothetical protein